MHHPKSWIAFNIIRHHSHILPASYQSHYLLSCASIFWRQHFQPHLKRACNFIILFLQILCIFFASINRNWRVNLHFKTLIIIPLISVFLNRMFHFSDKNKEDIRLWQKVEEDLPTITMTIHSFKAIYHDQRRRSSLV